MHRIVVPIAALLFTACPAHAAEKCDQLPQSVQEHAVYSGWSCCDVIRAGERRLWQGLGQNETRVTRFTFTHGHALFWRFVTITERPDGTGRLRMGGGGRNEDDFLRHRKLTAEQITHLNLLAEQAGAWAFPIGSWDGGEIYLHCEVLDMERIDAAGYRYSSANIGCNHPDKLMPLVNEVIRLAGMKAVNDRGLYE